jgi:uncharacterized protein YlxW (UPF0749 family)
MSSDKLFNISEAARATGKSIPTIHNYLKSGKLPNAVSQPNGKSKTWQIPLTDLVAARLLDKVESEPQSARDMEQDETQALREEIAALRAKSEQLESRVQEALKRAEFAERAYQNQIETRQTQDNRRTFQGRWFLCNRQVDAIAGTRS